MTGEEQDCNSCIQARNYDRLVVEQKMLAERGLKRDEALADIKLDTAVTKEKVTHLIDTTNDIKVSIKDFHLATEKSMAEFHLTTKEAFKDVQGSVKVIESQPGQNWRDMIKVIITVIVTAAITILFFNKT